MSADESSLPAFSIVVASRDRPSELSSCLRSLGALDYPSGRYDVVVVDDGSRASLEGVVEAATAELAVTYVRQEWTGPAGARNHGAERAGGEYLAFTDDDCRPHGSWLRELAARADGQDVAVGGRTLAGIVDNPYGVASQVIVDVVYGFYNADPDAARFFASNNLAVPAAAFRELGGFDERLTTAEDRDFCDRWLASGRVLRSAPAALVAHDQPLTFPRFVRQFFRYGRGAFRFHAARRARGRGVGMLTELWFYVLLPARVRRVLGPQDGRRRGLLLALLGVWQLANVAGFVVEGGSQLRRLARPADRAESRSSRMPVG